MLFSEIFGITRSNGDDWFDPILDSDTKLFIDPFLLYDSSHKSFPGCHDKIIDFFNYAFKLAAESEPDNRNIKFRMLKKMMKFSEVKEICLGYASKSTDGAGSGPGFSEDIVGAIYESIQMGIISTSHFEDLGLFGRGIGRDRISDAAANIIKGDLIRYTQEVCKQHDVPMEYFAIVNADFDGSTGRWLRKAELLPKNPYYEDRGIILVPMAFLNDLPTLDSKQFLDFCWENKNEEIRDEFSFDIKANILRDDIIRIAKARRDWVEEYEKIYEEDKPQPYDFVKDPLGLYNWYMQTRSFVENHPLTLETDAEADFEKNLAMMIDQFVDFIENNSGYKLLWNDKGTPKSEEASQLLFTGIVKHYCKANNIDLSREVNLGRGPVDFKFSLGYTKRALLEVKLAKNSKFWNGLELQLVKYLNVEDIKIGYFIVVCYNEIDFKKVVDIENRTYKLIKDTGLDILPIIIDATPAKPSASKL